MLVCCTERINRRETKTISIFTRSSSRSISPWSMLSSFFQPFFCNYTLALFTILSNPCPLLEHTQGGGYSNFLFVITHHLLYFLCCPTIVLWRHSRIFSDPGEDSHAHTSKYFVCKFNLNTHIFIHRIYRQWVEGMLLIGNHLLSVFVSHLSLHAYTWS